jgi:hypothetical protein
MPRLPRQHAVPVAAFAAACLAQAATADAIERPAACFKRSDLVVYLADQFKETPQVVAVTDAGMLLEVFASKRGATWTMAVTTPAGLTCLMATGQDWQSLPTSAEVGPPA